MNNSSLKARAHIFVSGKVQGVFFRHNTRQKAKDMGLTGWVKNLADGRVEAIFEGERGKVEEMLGWVKRGPILAKIDNVELLWLAYQNEFNDFEIKRD